MKIERDIVLFLGAGFSCGVGLPSMAKFGPASDDHLRRIDRPGHRERKAVPALLEAGKIFQDFQDYCQQARGIVTIDANNMEEVFCIAESLSQSGIQEIHLRGGVLPVDVLIENIQLWLWKMYHEFPPLNNERTDVSEDAKTTYNAFFQFLKENNLGARTSIITTNYDLTVEFYSWLTGVGCNYPIQCKNVNEISVVDRPRYDNYVRWGSPATDSLPTCKIHGSINIFKTESNYYVSADIAKPGERFGDSSVPPPARPAIFMQDAVWHMNQKYKKSFIPAVIPPTYSKIHAIPWLQDMWGYALESLKNAKLIVFIGYSIPESDGFIYSFLRASMAERPTHDSPVILIINPDGSVFERYSRLFHGLNKGDNLFSGTFIEAWQSGLLENQILKNLKK